MAFLGPAAVGAALGVAPGVLAGAETDALVLAGTVGALTGTGSYYANQAERYIEHKVDSFVKSIEEMPQDLARLIKNKLGEPTKKKARLSSTKTARIINDNKLGAKDESVSLACNTTGAVQLAFTLARGQDVSDRMGSGVRLDRVDYRLTVYGDSTAGLNNGMVALVYDKRPTDSLPAAGGAGAPFTSLLSYTQQNIATSNRFTILKRIDFQLLGPVAADNTRSAQMFKGSVNLRRRQASYDPENSSGDIAQIESGALYWVAIGNSVADTTDCQIEGSARLTFEN